MGHDSCWMSQMWSKVMTWFQIEAVVAQMLQHFRYLDNTMWNCGWIKTAIFILSHIHPSIHHLSKVRRWWQQAKQSIPDFFLPCKNFRVPPGGWIQTDKISFFCRVAGLSLRDRVSLGDPDGSQSRTDVSLCQLRWFGHLVCGCLWEETPESTNGQWLVFWGARCGPKCHIIPESYG